MRVIDVPRDIGKAIAQDGPRKLRHIPVHRWIEGLAFQNTLVPRGGGSCRMACPQPDMAEATDDAGAAVEVTMLLDSRPREDDAIVRRTLARELVGRATSIAATSIN